MKKQVDKYKKLMLSCMILILFAIVSAKIINNIEAIFVGIGWVLGAIWKLLIPFLIGFFIAFILNSAVNFIETDFANLFAKGKKGKALRIISVWIVYLVAISLITLAVVYLVPAVKDSAVEFKNNLPANLEKSQAVLAKFGISVDVNIEQELKELVTKFLSQDGSISSLWNKVMEGANAVLNIILGIIISIYILLDKENFLEGWRKFIGACFNKKKSDKIFEFCDYVTKTFNKFIVGKLVDSLIIGLIAYIGFLIMGIKYRLIFAIIIGITNIIPYFGPIMGAVPVGILVFLYNPPMTIPVLIFIFVLQQFDGNILGPMVLGDAIGVKPVEIILAIIVGGAIGGVLGMFLAVPTYVVIADSIKKLIESGYSKNQIEKEGKKSE